MIFIDKYAYSSKLAKVNPKGKIFFALLLLILCLALQSNIVSLTVFFIMITASVALGGVRLKLFLKYLTIPALFLITGVTAVVINRYGVNDNVLIGVHFSDYIYGITKDSLIVGLGLFLRAISAVSCMYFISFNTPMNALFQALEKSKMPKILIALTELIYRYIFILWDEGVRIRTAQKSRLGYKGFISSITCLGSLAGGLFLRSYLRGDRVYTALEARGYTGTFQSIEEVYSSDKYFYLLGLILGLILLTIKALEIL